MSAATLQAFTADEFLRAQELLARSVAHMAGRKLEEGDWSRVYTQAKGIPARGWSNLHIDVVHGALGVEHKMLSVEADLAALGGRRLMHPAATRSIRIDGREDDPEVVMRHVLEQYGAIIRDRATQIAVSEDVDVAEVDIRTGWLLWRRDLSEFLYWEEATVPPDPRKYTASWHSRAGSGARKATRNLWIFDRETGEKEFSVTTEAGIKIQPYFVVPPLDGEHAYHFVARGLDRRSRSYRTWVTLYTYNALAKLLGDPPDPEILERTILEACDRHALVVPLVTDAVPEAARVDFTETAWRALEDELPIADDDLRLRLLVDFLAAGHGRPDSG